MSALDAALDEARHDEAVGVVIVTGAGEKSFIAGADIGELSKLSPLAGRDHSRKGQAVVAKLENLGKPVIAAVNGYALGGGCELALACTMRIASENARFGQPEVKLGIIPGYGGSQRLARIVGEGRAMQLCLTAEQIDAAEAHRIGLVNKVVPAGQALAAAKEMARAMLANGPVACGLVLEAIRRGLEMPLAGGPGLRIDPLRPLRRDDGHEGGHERLPREAPGPFHGPLTAEALPMGTDLVSACIFCAGWLLGMDLAPRDGLSGQMGFSYATMARRYDVTPERVDSSDVTPKFVLVGLGNAWPAPDGLGAGTPASEWQARVAFGTSHDQQERKALPEEDLDRILTSGTGRYENFALLGRIRLGDRDSVEVALNRRAESATDLIDIGPQNGVVSESRSLSASRADYAVGWRHRWPGFEAEVGFHGSKPDGYNSTLGSFQTASGYLWGGEAEGRWRSGGWTVLLHGEGMWGNLDVTRESQPDFTQRNSSEAAEFEAIRLGGGYSWPKTQLFLTTTYERQKLPFVSIAVLGTETVAVRSGLRPALGQRRGLLRLRAPVRVHARDPRAPRRRARLGLRDGDADRLGGALAADRARRHAAGRVRRRAVRSHRRPGGRLLHRRRFRDRRARALTARLLGRASGFRLAREKNALHPPDSDLIYDWNRAGGAVFPARGTRRARRRDAARRPPVALGQEPVDRTEDPDPPPHGGARHRLGRHRPARRRAPRGRDRHPPGAKRSSGRN